MHAGKDSGFYATSPRFWFFFFNSTTSSYQPFPKIVKFKSFDEYNLKINTNLEKFGPRKSDKYSRFELLKFGQTLHVVRVDVDRFILSYSTTGNIDEDAFEATVVLILRIG